MPLRLLLALVLLPMACQSGHRLPNTGETPEYITDPNSILRIWQCLGAHKDVTKEYPTDYQIGGIYRLRGDVVVEHGGTASTVTPYWVCECDSERVEKTKGEIAARKCSGRAILPAGTRLRFEQIWLEGNQETGVTVHPYAMILDGPLDGQRVGIGLITDRQREPGMRRERCNVDATYLEAVEE